MILKATSEQGERLNIKKAHLKEWRIKFAAHLRELGVAANATPRLFRGQQVRAKSTTAYWAQRRLDGDTAQKSVRTPKERVLEPTR